MRIVEQCDLTPYNSYRIKAVCAKAYFPETEQDIVLLFQKKERFILLGSGHNIILSKSFYEESFVIFNGNFNHFYINESGVIKAEAGISMYDLSTIALENNLSGLEMFYDIPSSLGGAVVMNAGASGEEIKDLIVKVRYLDLDNFQIKEKANSEIDFTYRNSFFQRNTNTIVLKAWLQLDVNEGTKIEAKMNAIKEARWSKQPKEYPNAGSVFKRPKGYYVGAMLDELGLKGFSVGGAQVSEKHSGFIINYNNATGEDILSLIKEIQIRVQEKFSVTLEVEQRVI